MILALTIHRIVVRTSTTKREITMTTDLQLRRAFDVLVDNDVLRVPSTPALVEQRLAAAAWIAEGERPVDAHRRALDLAAGLVLTKLTGYALWLLVGHSAWQPDSRVTRHRRLWKSLEGSGLRTPLGRHVDEGFIEAAEGLRYFGALQLSPGPLDPVVAILEAERVSHLVALRPRDEPVVAALARTGWDRPYFGPSAQVLEAVCGADGVVLWPVGAFDDREAGAVALAKPEVLDTLLS
jgi:hypothetical protein